MKLLSPGASPTPYSSSTLLSVLFLFSRRHLFRVGFFFGVNPDLCRSALDLRSFAVVKMVTSKMMDNLVTVLGPDVFSGDINILITGLLRFCDEILL